jgi:antagonist of KipI
MASIIIKSAGMLTTVQDQGRYGYQRYGMPVSGAMDIFSYELANLLVGNKVHEACLETTITGPEILFTDAGAVALCGADMGPLKNGMPVSMNKTIKIESGDMLSFRGLKNGCRCYIAFAGGINVPPVMGSRSTYLRAKTGGFGGRALSPGDELALGVSEKEIRILEIPGKLLLPFKSSQTIRICPGPEINRFGLEGIQKLLTSEYTVTDHSDRMGYRLAGNIIKHKSSNADIISAGISAGTIQIPGDGQPVILMADRQTTGGYSRIANVISADLTLLAQMIPGDHIRFREISLKEAQSLYIAREKILRELFKETI